MDTSGGKTTNKGKGASNKDKTKDSYSKKGNPSKGKGNPGKGVGSDDHPGQGNAWGLYKNGKGKQKMEVVETRYFYEGLSHLVHKEYSPSALHMQSITSEQITELFRKKCLVITGVVSQAMTQR